MSRKKRVGNGGKRISYCVTRYYTNFVDIVKNMEKYRQNLCKLLCFKMLFVLILQI